MNENNAICTACGKRIYLFSRLVSAHCPECGAEINVDSAIEAHDALYPTKGEGALSPAPQKFEINVGDFEITDGTLIKYKGAGGHIGIPDNVRAIGKEAFRGSGVKSVYMQRGIVTVGERAFLGCKSLERVELSESLKNIGALAFWGCELLTDVRLPRGLEKIEEYAFRGCASLKSLLIPRSVVELGRGVFGECPSLESIEIEPSEKPLFKVVKGCLIAVKGGELIAACHGAVISAKGGVTVIGEHAFSRRRGLGELVIPKGVAVIRKSAFESCEGLTGVRFPEGLNNIEESAFESCKELTSVSFHEGALAIRDNAFRWCKAIRRVILPKGITHVGAAAFYGCDALERFSFEEPKRWLVKDISPEWMKNPNRNSFVPIRVSNPKKNAEMMKTSLFKIIVHGK